MGILDDAIREHLELKRRHGVPEEELERQQEEALGPARRDVAQQHEEPELAPGQPATAEPGDGEAHAQEPALFDMEGDAEVEEPAAEAIDPATEAGEPAIADHASVVDEPTDLGEGPAPFAEEAPVAEPPVEDPSGAVAEEPVPDEPPASMEPPPVAEEHDKELAGDEPGHDPDERLGETQPHGFEALDDDAEEPDPLAADLEEEDLDVLEDTPDFLQETPEHDRLWFEQKPPRDFDFD